MFTFLSILYVIVCLFLILVVLLQTGKGGGMGALGGGMGGAGQQVFGGAGAGNILTKATSWSAALFMILSATLSYLSSPGEQALEDVAASISGSSSETAPDGESEDSERGAAATEEPVADEAVADEAVADEAVADEAVADEAVADEEAAEDPSMEAPAEPANAPAAEAAASDDAAE